MIRILIISIISFLGLNIFALPTCYPNMLGEVRFESGVLYHCNGSTWEKILLPLTDDNRKAILDNKGKKVGHISPFLKNDFSYEHFPILFPNGQIYTFNFLSGVFVGEFRGLTSEDGIKEFEGDGCYYSSGDCSGPCLVREYYSDTKEYVGYSFRRTNGNVKVIKEHSSSLKSKAYPIESVFLKMNGSCLSRTKNEGFWEREGLSYSSAYELKNPKTQVIFTLDAYPIPSPLKFRF